MNNPYMKQSEYKPNGVFEYLLTHYRGWFSTFFLLPISFVYYSILKIRRRIIFLLRSAPSKHAIRVEYVQKQIQEWIASGAKEKLTTGRSGWFTMSELVPAYKKTYRKIYLNMYDILEINEDKQTVRVEPLVTMGQITAALNPRGWTLPVVPELDDLTVGGLVNGFGVETSSHKYGLFQYICESFEIVTADGKLVKCSKDENPDLFSMIPWSHGTLGFLVAIELKIIPAKKYVKLTYTPVYSQDELIKKFEEESRNTHDNDFVEALAYSKDTAVIMTGKMTDKIEKDGKVNHIRRWYKPWFYLYVQKKLDDHKESIDYIPLRQYYHRHTRSLFWMMSEIIPFGYQAWHRFLFGWGMPPQVSLMKYFETETTRKLREKYSVVQDMLMPISKLKISLDHFDKNFNIYPLWLCPMKVMDYPNKIGFIHPYKELDGSIDELFVDIGAYGVGKIPGFDGSQALRNCEQFVIENAGYQAMYAKTLLSHEDFRKMFDHSYYDILREKLPMVKNAFPEMYHKLSNKARVAPIDYKKNRNIQVEEEDSISTSKTV